MKEVKVLYRYIDDFIWTSTTGGHHEITLKEYNIIKETDCGYWIEFDNKKRRKWVNKSGTSYARTTKESAFNHYKHRKNKQLEILKNKTRICKEFIKMANDFKIN